MSDINVALGVDTEWITALCIEPGSNEPRVFGMGIGS